MNTEQTIPLSVSGIRHVIERLYREGDPEQSGRELLMNAIEANAQNVEIGLTSAGQLYFADDGDGMSPDDLARYMGSIGASSKGVTNDLKSNFGMGGRVSTLPANPNGVVVFTRTADNPKGIAGVTKLVGDEYGFTYPVSFRGIPKIGKTGTTIVLLGGGADPVKAPETSVFRYLTRRMWTLPLRASVAVSRKKRSTQLVVKGAYESLARVAKESGTVEINDGAKVHWFVVKKIPHDLDLRHGRNPVGFLAFLYRNELYGHTDHPLNLAKFGVVGGKARSRCVIVVEPPEASSIATGVFPDGSRSRLLWSGPSRDLPVATWAEEFRSQLPDAIAKLDSALDDESPSQWKDRVAKALSRLRLSLGAGAAKKAKDAAQGVSRTRGPNVNKSKKQKDTETGNRIRSEMLPDFKWVKGDAFEENIGGMWIPGKPGTLHLNSDFPSVKAMTAHWTKRYPHATPAMVRSQVHECFGVIAIETLIHASGLTKLGWDTDRVATLFTPEAITSALLGITAVDTLIGRRLPLKVGAGK